MRSCQGRHDVQSHLARRADSGEVVAKIAPSATEPLELTADQLQFNLRWRRGSVCHLISRSYSACEPIQNQVNPAPSG